MRRVWFPLLLAGLLAYLAPAIPALLRYGALPSTPERPITLLLAGTTPNYPRSAVWPYPRTPEDYTGITDTIVLAQLRPGERSVRLLNIPRDTWMNIPGWGWGKINGANPHGGPEMLMNAVQDLTGLRPEGYALLSLNALRDLTDAAGGVTVTVAQPMRYDDAAGKLHIDLQPGRQILSGPQAEGYLRFRHDALGDIGRVARQQQFIKALSAKLLSPWGLWRAPMVVGALNQNAKTNLSREQVGALLGSLLTRPSLSAQTLPGSFGPGGTWSPDRAAIAALVRRDMNSGDARDLSVAVVNLAAPAGSARRLKDRLEDLGYRHVWIADEGRHAGPTAIHARNGRGPAQQLRADVGYGSVLSDGDGVPGADLTIRLGSDTP